MGAVATLFLKELRVELRNAQAISSFIMLAILVLAAFRFAFSSFDGEDIELAAPILWLTIFFAGLLSLTPLYRREVDGHTRDGLVLAPTPHGSIFLGKLAASLLVVLVLELLTVVLFFVFFPFGFPDAVALASVLVLGTLGFVTIGNVLSAISSRLAQSGVMLMVLGTAVLLFTVVLSAVSATSTVFEGGGLSDVEGELRLLAVYALVFFAIGYLFVDNILEA